MKKVYLAADVGTNWQGNLKFLCEDFIPMLKGAGVDGIKVQLIPDAHDVYAASDDVWKRWPNLQEMCLGFLQAEAVRDACRSNSIDWFASVFREVDVEPLAKLQPRFIKVAARNAGHWGILQEAAKTNLTTIISLADDHRCLTNGEYFKLFKVRSRYKLIYCVSKYPAEPSDYEPERFREADGISDHTITTAVPITAAAIGLLSKSWFYVEVHARTDGLALDATPDASCSKSLTTLAVLSEGLRRVERLSW